MAELVVKDIPTCADITKGNYNFKLKDFSIQYIKNLLKPYNPTLGREIRTTWLEYEIGKTVEAQ